MEAVCLHCFLPKHSVTYLPSTSLGFVGVNDILPLFSGSALEKNCVVRSYVSSCTYRKKAGIIFTYLLIYLLFNYLLTYIITAIELSPGGSNPSTITDRTIMTKCTWTKQYKSQTAVSCPSSLSPRNVSHHDAVHRPHPQPEYTATSEAWRFVGHMYVFADGGDTVERTPACLLTPLTIWSLLVTWCATCSTFNNCRLCPHCIYVFCIYLRANSDLCHLQHKLIGFYNRDEKCLQSGTDWDFK